MRSWVSILVIIAAILLVAPAGRASVTDDGQVVVETDGSLSIGRDAYGRREVVGEADGVYTAASLGLLDGGHGELALTDGSTFETTGQLIVGAGGGAVLDVASGSRLLTGSVRLVGLDAWPAQLYDPVRVQIVGEGSEWINGGLLRLNSERVHAYVDFELLAGARLESNGITAWGAFADGAHTNITVDGPGTTWNNSGRSLIYGAATFTISGGASATDADVDFGDSYNTARAVVEGAGSIWRTQDLRLSARSDGFVIQNGGRVESTSAYLSSQTTQTARVQGPGSTWSISGELLVAGNPAGGDSHLVVSDSGLLEAGSTGVGVGETGYASIEVVGAGSTFRNSGELLLAGWPAVGATFGVRDGGTATTSSMTVGCGNVGTVGYGDRCQVNVTGVGSLITVTNDVEFTSHPENPDGFATWTVGDGGRVDVGQDFTVVDSARVFLADGTVAAQQLTLQGGALTGDGLVQSAVGNSGLVAPGAAIGRLTIDGSYAQGQDGTLSITLGGLAPGIAHDVLEVLGTSALGGELRVELASGYVPDAGDSFEILTASSISGEFDSYVGLSVSPDLELTVEYLPDRIRLVTAPIPEPGTALLVMIGLVGVATQRRQRLLRSR